MKNNPMPCEALENAIGYRFSNKELLQQALTHTSYANEHRKQGCPHNERLEFLGDAVLELVSSGYLYERYPEKPEGELSRLRASMVCEPSLAKCARELGLPGCLRLGRGEELMGGRTKDSLISDALEAVIGAVYLDGGFPAARELVLKHILLTLSPEDLFMDAKTRLQELLQDRNRNVEYAVLQETGPDHDKHFLVAACLDGVTLATGEGRTKKAAAQEAALAALKEIKIRGLMNVSEID